jgi:hypothetical protein
MAGFFHRALIENFGLKLISLLLAVGLWFLVARDPISEVETRVPIEFRNLPENLEIDSASFTQAQIRVRGPERVIHRLQPGDVRAQVDLSTVHPGERTFDLTSRQVHVPQDLDVVQVVPSQFQLSFDERTTRTVEVHPRVIGSFARGMRNYRPAPTSRCRGVGDNRSRRRQRNDDAPGLYDSSLCARSSDPGCAPHADPGHGYHGTRGRREKEDGVTPQS